MGRGFQHLAGGLLSGIGKGMAAQIEGTEKRELMLEKIRQERSIRQEDRDFKATEGDKTREHQRGLIHGTVTGKDGSVTGITKGGDAIDTGIKGAKGAGMSAEDKRLLDIVVQRHTTEGLQGKRVKHEAVAADLRQRGRPDLASIYSEPGDVAEGPVDVNSPQWREAEKMAEKWAEEQAGYFSTDATDFAAHGGNRAAAKQAKRLEFFRELQGKSHKGTATPPRGDPEVKGAPAQGRRQADGQAETGLPSFPTGRRPHPRTSEGGAAQRGQKGSKDKKPAEYPDARWSDKAGGWVVSRNGRWFLIEQ